jgi:hypothetical protein
LTGPTGASGGVASFNGRTGAIVSQASDITSAGGALLASPAFTGLPTAPTVGAADNSQSLATTAFVQNKLVGTVTTFNGRSGAVTLNTGDVTGAGGAPQNNAALTGIPTAPTAAPATATTQLATTAFVGTSFAPLASPALTGTPTVPTAPAGTATTQAASAAFVQAAVAPAFNDTGRNLLHNALLAVQQRATGPWTVSGSYTADRWAVGAVGGDTFSASLVAAADADRAAIGDEATTTLLQVVFTGTSGTTSYSQLYQGIERIRRLGGKTVAFSFWARRTAGTAPKLGISIDQYFGSGGTPSAELQGTGVAITLSTTWTRYSGTIAIPSTSGKTLGTNSDDANYLSIWFSSGANNNAFAGGIGVQSGTVQFWGAQLEIGSVATPLEKPPDPQVELAKCQRFYQTGHFNLIAYAAAGAGSGMGFPFPTPFRVPPQVIAATTTNTNCSALAINAAYTDSFLGVSTAVALGMFQLAGTFTASADI